MKKDQSYLPNIIIILNFLHLINRKYQATRARIRDATFVFFLILCRCNFFMVVV